MVSFNPAITERLNALSDGVLNGHYIFSRDYEDALARRYSQPEKYAHNITYGVSNNPKHLQQYYNIRQQAYKEVLQKYIRHGAVLQPGIDKDFYAGEDEYDRRGVLFLAIAGDNCIGGIRLMASTPQKPNKLSMEDENFCLQDHYPELDLSKITYCEASKFAILPDFRHGDVSNQIHIKSTEYLINQVGMEIVFCQSHKLSTERFRMQFQNSGYEMIVRKDIKTHATEQFKAMGMRFWAVDFTADQKYADKLRAPLPQPALATELEFA